MTLMFLEEENDARLIRLSFAESPFGSPAPNPTQGVYLAKEGHGEHSYLSAVGK